MAIVALGVTGHRYVAARDEIMAGMESVLQRILETFPHSDFRVLSSLAEGADRILAKRLLLILGASLWVPLPLSEEEYLKDFKTRASKQEFVDLLGKAERVITLPVTSKREEAYRTAGNYILDHSDLLMTIWDGKPARGDAGTGEMVALARKRGLPLAWIHAGNHRNPGQGPVSFEHFPPPGR
jgi:hypothetical protein